MSSITKLMRLEQRLLVRSLGNRSLASSNLARNRRGSSILNDRFNSPHHSFPTNQTPTLFLTSHTIRCFSVDSDTMSVSNIQEAIRQHVQEGDIVTADQALIRLEKVALSTNDDEIDLDTYTMVLDAWIQHQKEVEEGGPHEVNQVAEAAHRAHAILEKLQRKLLESNDSDAMILRPTQHHYEAVLEAWLYVTRRMLALDTPLRGIPQRAQRILEQFQEQASTDPTIQPTIHHYNTVLEIWGNSPEHLRATMAETLFQQLPPEMEADKDTYLVLIRTWCRSKQDRAAFTATGHLMKMLRIMGKGDNKVEITMEDYKTILEAWTRAA